MIFLAEYVHLGVSSTLVLTINNREDTKIYYVYFIMIL